MTTTNKSRIIIYWITTILSAMAFMIPGIGNLTHQPHFAADMAHLGYPAYFLTVFGLWKILGAISIIAPNLKRLKEWAYAGMIFDLTGAAFSRISSHDATIMIVIPLIITSVVLASWFLRPESRKL
jgi:uncharacterized membrane protein YphA (DoxX/SURF4 family)